MTPSRLLAALAFLLVCGSAEAQTPSFSPEVEAQARVVGKSLRCVVCQNQSIEESHAPLAADMRRLVRERLTAGETPKQVMAYMTARYGNFVLMKPPFQADTLLLWLGPLGFVAIAAVSFIFYLRPGSRQPALPAALTDEESAELARRLKEDAPS